MPAPFILGWEEWVALPELGLPAVKAKVDTGARTSALHAFLIEPFGPAAQPMVRFGVHPLPGREDIEIYCSAPVVDRRDVTSSNGEKETRFVISTPVRIGERDWPIEMTLTNREAMAYRMLLGRQAIREDMFVDPASSFRQPKLSYKLYRHLPRRDPVRRPLRIALLTTLPASSSTRKLERAAAARGHVLETIDADRLTLSFCQSGAGIALDGTPLPHYDAVLARVSGRRRAAGLRQLELMGSMSLAPADAIARLADDIALAQALQRLSLPVRPRSVSLAEAPAPAPSGRERNIRLELMVVGDAVAAAIETRHGHEIDVGERPLDEERRLALAAARALDLGLGVIALEHDGEHLVVTGATAWPSLARVERVTGVQLAPQIIATIEQRVRSWVRRTPSASGASPDLEAPDT